MFDYELSEQDHDDLMDHISAAAKDWLLYKQLNRSVQAVVFSETGRTDQIVVELKATI